MSNEMTNEKFVSHLMNYSPTGAMSQIFVIEAIRFYTLEVVLKQPRPTENPPESLFNRIAWWDTAKYIENKFKEVYEAPRNIS